ncbi:hypothetical protein OSB04_un001615 [Centaurea solstitialis]|uniref:Uncharacterized protein n=1 Tax=Centaurea solstitialis TaxID=347529 RepID=A0AA38SNF0_9ASTR|nr:hypothetical protein OSB04_un001615 [Centaurea solstitialis]
MKEQTRIHDRFNYESFQRLFRVRLDNEDIILGYVSGKIRRSFIRILQEIESKLNYTEKGSRGRMVHMYGGEWFLGLCRYLWLPRYKKRDAIAVSNRSGKCYSCSSDQGMQREKVRFGRDAALRAIRRSGITINFRTGCNPMPIMAVDPRKKDYLLGHYSGSVLNQQQKKGQADTIGLRCEELAWRNEGTCITRAKLRKYHTNILHNGYSRIST